MDLEAGRQLDGVDRQLVLRGRAPIRGQQAREPQNAGGEESGQLTGDAADTAPAARRQRTFDGSRGPGLAAGSASLALSFCTSAWYDSVCTILLNCVR